MQFIPKFYVLQITFNNSISPASMIQIKNLLCTKNVNNQSIDLSSIKHTITDYECVFKYEFVWTQLQQYPLEYLRKAQIKPVLGLLFV